MKHLIATAVLSACSMAYANTHISNYNTDSHLYEFTQTYDLIAPKGSQGQANLWVPLPFNGEYQQVKSIRFEGNYSDDAELVERLLQQVYGDLVDPADTGAPARPGPTEIGRAHV